MIAHTVPPSLSNSGVYLLTALHQSRVAARTMGKGRQCGRQTASPPPSGRGTAYWRLAGTGWECRSVSVRHASREINAKEVSRREPVASLARSPSLPSQDVSGRKEGGRDPSRLCHHTALTRSRGQVGGGGCVALVVGWDNLECCRGLDWYGETAMLCVCMYCTVLGADY